MLARSLYLAAFLAASQLVVGCSRPWPAVRPAVHPSFTGAEVMTVDVLPVDVALASHRKSERTPEMLQQTFDPTALGAIEAALARRGYAVSAMISWDGTYAAHDGTRRRAFSPDEVGALTEQLAGYSGRRALTRGVSGVDLPGAGLPVRLGAMTGADATLYVGGVAFEGKDRNRGRDVAMVAFFVVFAVVIIAVIAVAAKGGGKGGGGGGKGGGGGIKGGGGGGSAIGSVGRGVGRTAVGATRAMGRPLRGFARAMVEVGRSPGHWHLEMRSPDPGPPSYHGTTYPMATGHVAPPAFPDRGPSFSQVEMTLVDNHTGQVLWHARQTFPANPAKPEHVHRLVERMLATLPARR